MTKTTQATTGYILAEKQPFSQSVLWDWQERYFAEKGVEAWRQGEVPHYVTSNPTMASSYAEMVFAFWRDHQCLKRQDINPDEPLYICELGAGSGRFAFREFDVLRNLSNSLTTCAPNHSCFGIRRFIQNVKSFPVPHHS